MAAKGHPKCDGELSCSSRQSRIHFDKSFNYILHHSTISAVCAMMCSIIFLNNFLNLVREMCLFLLVVAHGNIEIDKANENEKSICFGSHDVDPSAPMQHSSYGLTSKTSQYFLLLKAYTSSLNIAVCYTFKMAVLS